MNIKTALTALSLLLIFISCKEKTHCYNCVTGKYINGVPQDETTKTVCGKTEEEIKQYQRDNTATTKQGFYETHTTITTCQ